MKMKDYVFETDSIIPTNLADEMRVAIRQSIEMDEEAYGLAETGQSKDGHCRFDIKNGDVEINFFGVDNEGARKPTHMLLELTVNPDCPAYLRMDESFYTINFGGNVFAEFLLEEINEILESEGVRPFDGLVSEDTTKYNSPITFVGNALIE